MDHSWGRYVTELGLGSIGASLAAPTLTFPHIVLTNARGLEASQFQQWFTFPDTDDAWFWINVLKLEPHFPYGYGFLIPPDEPL